MRVLIVGILSLAPTAAFACAMYIPNEKLERAMVQVDEAAKAPVVVAPVVVQPQPAGSVIPEVTAPVVPAPPTSMIPEVEPAS
ncbi:MAG TPA: hypothetical protein PLA94_14325 [Myxococcota bacterium]|nr:hypothetical protein [Myxococcota bacterium]